jgi:hypothetical protein
MYTYFDALAQATAALYGPNLAGPNAELSMVAAPSIKTAIVDSKGVSKFPASGLAVNTWNALLDTEGSLLGGNNWRDDSNGAYSVTRPSVNYDASLPYQGAQILRFQPLDLYVLGFASPLDTFSIRSFLSAQPTDLFYPKGVTSWNGNLGPNMGMRVGGVILMGGAGIPTEISFNSIKTGNGGERIPSVAEAPQHIRQLWILVTKPTTLVDQIATDEAAKAGAKPTAAEDSKAAQAKEQTAEIEKLQQFRRAWGPYFYMLTNYTGRVVSTFEGNVDDMAYWEFADVADDQKFATAVGGLVMEIEGTKPEPNGGGSKKSVLLVKSTPGTAGAISLKESPALKFNIQGGTKASASPNEIFSIRMKLPANEEFIDKAKGKVVLNGSKGAYEFSFPEDGYLVADGTFRNYTVLLAQKIARNPDAKDESGAPKEALKTEENTAFTGKDFDSLTITPSDIPMENIEIEFVKLGNRISIWPTNATVELEKDTAKRDQLDVDLNCEDHYQPDTWLFTDDNCPNFYNPDQLDANQNGIGDACEDFDGDGVLNACDPCAARGGTSPAECKGEKSGVAGYCAVNNSSDHSRLPMIALFLLALGAGLTLRGLRRQARKK